MDLLATAEAVATLFAAGEAAMTAWNGMRRLSSVVISKLARHPEAIRVLEELQEHPADEERRRAVANAVAVAAQEDAGFRDELERLMADAQQNETIRQIITQVYQPQLGGIRTSIGAVHQLVIRGSEKDAAGRPKVRHNLPRPDYSDFLDREEEFARLHGYLSKSSRAALIEVDGIGGIGKSALALQVASELVNVDSQPESHRYEAIVWTSAKEAVLTSMGIRNIPQATRTMRDIFNAIAFVLDRDDIIRAPNGALQLALVRQALADTATVLVVDNFDTLEDDPDMLQLLGELPGVTKCLITTRRRVHSSYFVTLRGMPEKEGLALIDVECRKRQVILKREEARKLYERTGGVPLAIVWSVARISQGTSVTGLLAELGTAQGDITEFCFEQALESIAETDAYWVLLAFALFADSASEEAVAYVANLAKDHLSCKDALEVLTRLSLVNQDGGRYSVLPLTREFARAQLDQQPGFRQEATERLIAYYVQYVGRYSREDFAGHAAFEVELHNLWHVLTLCRVSGREDALSRLMMGLDLYFWVRGLWNEAIVNLESMLKYGQRSGDPIVMAHAHRALGRIYLYGGQEVEACQHLEKAYEDFRDAGRLRDALSAASYLGLAYAYRQHFHEAEHLLEEALQEASNASLPAVEARLSNTLAEIDFSQRRFSAARQRVERILTSDQEEWDRSTVGLGWTYLLAGKLALHDKDVAGARQFFQDSLRIAVERKIEQDAAYAILWLAELEGEESNVGQALELAEQAYEIFTRLGDRRGATDAQELLASRGWARTIWDKFMKVE